MRKRKGFLIFGGGLLAALVTLFLYAEVKKSLDPQYLQIQEWKKVTNEIFQSHYIRRDFLDKEAHLNTLLPHEWDVLFRVEGGGTTTSKTVERAIKQKTLSSEVSSYKVYNERFFESEDGFVFVDSKKRIAFSIVLDVPLSGVKNTYLIKPKNLCVKGMLGPNKNYFFFVKKCGEEE